VKRTDIHDSLAVLLEKERAAVEAKEREIARLTEDLKAAREAASKADAVQNLETQLLEMQQFLRALDERSSSANAATVQALVEQLNQKQALDSEALEQRFNQTLDASLEKFTKTVEAATAKPIDFVVEATDVLVDKIFDTPAERMSTNLGQLDVDEKKSKRGIGGSLAALRAMKAGQAKAKEGESGEDKPEGDGKAPAPGVKGALERLKAVRGDKK